MRAKERKKLNKDNVMVVEVIRKGKLKVLQVIKGHFKLSGKFNIKSEKIEQNENYIIEYTVRI